MFILAATIAAFIFGTLIGSFLNVVIWRLPRGKDLGGRSKCPHCGSILQPINLLPLLSYALQRGKCSYCHKSLSPRYPLIEFITGALFAFAAWHTLRAGLNPGGILELARLLFALAILVVVFVIDLEHYLILDVVVLPAAVVMLVFNLVLDLSSYHTTLVSFSSYTGGGLLGACLAAGFFYLLWRLSQGRWMGFGDVKLAVFLGLALGFPGTIVGLFLAFMIGALCGVLLIAFGLKRLQSHVPFGTFLSVGAALGLFYGPALADWYSRLIGWR